MTLMGIVQDYHGLLIARIFLGVTEAGLFPGVAYYITMWYCRHEAQMRQALFFSAASVAGAFSGLLAFGIAHMDGVGNYSGWRWIFILEGILTVVVAVIAYFTLYDFPETAGFLTEEERAFVVWRLKYQGNEEGATVMVAQDDSFQWKYVKAAFLDWQIWTNVWVYWGNCECSRLRSLGLTDVQASSRLSTVSRFSCRLSSRRLSGTRRLKPSS